MSNIKSYSKDNAVKVIAFAIYFDQRLSDEDISKLSGAYLSDNFLNEEFIHLDTQNEVAITIDPNGIKNQTQKVGGIICRAEDDKKRETWMLSINRESVIVTCKNYTRWKEISDKAFKYISKSFDLLDKEDVSQITLEYLDEFEILSTSSDTWKNDLFKTKNKYLPLNIYSLNDYWHINHGYFTNIKGLDNKLLNTVNINYFADEQDQLKPKVNIRTQHHLRYENIEKYKCKDIENNFNIIHIHSKNIFEEIIHDDILKGFKRGELS